MAFVGTDLLRVPRGQVRGALEESAAPVQGHRGDAALRQGRGRVLREGLQARAARDLGLVGGADPQEQVTLRIQVEGLVVGTQKRAGRQRRRRIQVVQRGESRKGLRRRGGRVRGGGGRIQEDLAGLRVDNRAPRRVAALSRGCRDRRPQRLDILGGNRVPTALRITGNRCGFKRRGRGSVRRSGRLRRTTGTHQRRRRHECGASAYNGPHRRAMHGFPFVVTSVPTVPVHAPTQPTGPPSFGAEAEGAAMEFDVTIEIPKGNRNKYEIDHETGRIRLDRMLFTSTRYPDDYGFIDDTLGEDGDPLDALVLLEEPTFPGCVIRCRALGMFRMRDEKGGDDKVLCVPRASRAPTGWAAKRPRPRFAAPTSA